MLHTVEVGAPPSVELARRETRRVPDSSRAWLDLAAVLEAFDVDPAEHYPGEAPLRACFA